jgi:Uma2 family endonuclease
MPDTASLLTAEQFLEIADGRRCELVRGEVVEMSPVQRKHSWVVALLLSWMVPYARRQKLGMVGTELGFILSRDPDVVRAPDLYFVSFARWGDLDANGFFVGAPDLAVEVLSPEDRASKVQEKVREYFAAGCSLVWIVDPDNATVTVYPSVSEAHVLSGRQSVTAETLLPGFPFVVEQLFQPAL